MAPTKRTGRSTIALAALATIASVALSVPAVAGATERVTTVTVSAGSPTEFAFKLSKKTFKHGAVSFRVTNVGTVPHDFKICASPKGTTKANACTGKATKLLAPKGKATLTYTFKAKGTYEYICTVPSHAALGMKGVLKVT
jgi:plastocyanin